MKKREKNCPLCDGESNFERAGFRPIGVRITGGWVICQKCGAIGPLKSTKPRAISAWNRRVSNG